MTEPRFSAMVFLCGAHLDQIIRLKGAAVLAASNPAHVDSMPGGAALNMAGITGATLPSTLLSPVGGDPAGGTLRALIADRPFTARLITETGVGTGIYAGILDAAGELVIGAADLAIYDRVTPDWLREHLPPTLEKTTGLCLTANLSDAATRTAAELAGDRFLAAAAISPAKALRLTPLLPRLDLLFANRRELAALSGLSDAGGKELAEWCMAQGVKSGTVTDGGGPVWYWDARRLDHRTPPGVPVTGNVNGAGDAFAGAVIAALGRGVSIKTAIDCGMVLAGHIIGCDAPFSPSAGERLRQLLSGEDLYE